MLLSSFTVIILCRTGSIAEVFSPIFIWDRFSTLFTELRIFIVSIYKTLLILFLNLIIIYPSFYKKSLHSIIAKRVLFLHALHRAVVFLKELYQLLVCQFFYVHLLYLLLYHVNIIVKAGGGITPITDS